jgi:hypothetical protein
VVFFGLIFKEIDMDANITEAIMINIERKILIRSESIAILKLLNILFSLQYQSQ